MRHSICASELSFEKHKPDNYGILRTKHRTCAPCSEPGMLICTRILINLLESTCCYRIFHCFHQIAFAFKSIFVEPTTQHAIANHRRRCSDAFSILESRPPSDILQKIKLVWRMWAVPPKKQRARIENNGNSLMPAELTTKFVRWLMPIKTNCRRKFGNNNFPNALRPAIKIKMLRVQCRRIRLRQTNIHNSEILNGS